MTLAKNNTHYFFSQSSVFVLLILLSCIMTSCVTPSSVPTPPISPLIPGDNSVLINNRWHLIQVHHEDKQVEFGALDPVYISFNKAGSLTLEAGCPAVGHWIYAKDDNHYQLSTGESPAVLCKPLETQQFDAVKDALQSTTEYKIQDGKLFLVGNDSKLIFEIDNPH